MKIERVILHHLNLPMKEPFVTSFGSEENKDVMIVQVVTDNGAVGFAECVASSDPFYSEETTQTAWHILTDFLAQPVLGKTYENVDDLKSIRHLLAHVRGNKMAKAAMEMAVWDAYANTNQIPLVELLGGKKTEIAVGISVGIQPTIEGLVQKVGGYLEQGFKRIKVKVKPGHDYAPLRALRDAFGDILLMADANSAYRLGDIDQLKRLDELGLMMIEQPLANDDIIDHATLQKTLQTPICLDESIHTAEDARKAIEIGACKIINVKVGRVGGFGEALAIHNLCLEQGIDIWCGGMLETGIGRLHNIALTALPGFTLPGDTAPSARYFEEDIIQPAVTFSRPGYLAVESLCGVSSRVQTERFEKWSVRRTELS